MGDRIDEAGFGGIRVIQREGFGYGVDSVLLAAFAAGETGARPAAANSRIADLGTGCGIIAFILAHKLPGSSVLAIEKSPDAADRAARACDMNGMTERVSILCSDINDVKGRHDFDAVVSNPPYFRRSAGAASHTDERYISRHETTADIGDFARTASSMLRRGGDLYLVHRPDRLADIFTAMRDAGIEPKELQMVVPAACQPANIVLVHGIKDAGPELKVLPEITVHTQDGGYTDEILSYYERN